jgi:hypothetical protein
MARRKTIRSSSPSPVEAAIPLLQEVVLLESHSVRGTLKDGELPSRGEQKITFSEGPEREGEWITIVSLSLALNYSDPEAGDPAIRFGARFGMRYLLQGPLLSKDAKVLLRHSTLADLWPYWREFVQSLAVRMALPPFPVNLPKESSRRYSNPDRET